MIAKEKKKQKKKRGVNENNAGVSLWKKKYWLLVFMTDVLSQSWDKNKMCDRIRTGY